MTGLLNDSAGHCPSADVLLPSIALFHGLDAESLADICPTAEAFSLAAGELLFAQNDPGDGAYIIGTGKLGLFGRTPGDGLRRLTTVGTQEVFGEMCLLDGGRRSAEARAEEDVHGFRIDFEKFAALRAGGRPVAFEILRRLQDVAAARSLATIAEIVRLTGAEPLVEDVGAGRGTQAEASNCQALLHTFPGFDRFKAADWQEFAALVRRLDLARGTRLAAGELYCVARGAVRSAAGTGQLLIHGPGNLVGGAAMVHGGRWPAGLDIREDAVLFALSPAAFAIVRKPQGALACRLFDLLSRQLSTDLRRISRARSRLEIASPYLQRAH